MLIELPVVEQRYLAVREVLDTGATIVEVPSSHVAMVSHPDEVTQLIKTAAEASPAAA